VVTLREARARLSELVEEVNAEGGETILTRNGEACAALIGVERLEHYHRLEREHVRLTLLVEALRGLDDLEKSETVGLSELRSRLGSSDSGA
jgi:prevent-host-death family protein